jgi:hypothetical protein
MKMIRDAIDKARGLARGSVPLDLMEWQGPGIKPYNIGSPKSPEVAWHDAKIKRLRLDWEDACRVEEQAQHVRESIEAQLMIARTELARLT